MAARMRAPAEEFDIGDPSDWQLAGSDQGAKTVHCRKMGFNDQQSATRSRPCALIAICQLLIAALQ
jgi:hypothetical protein